MGHGSFWWRTGAASSGNITRGGESGCLERFRPWCLQLRWMSVVSHPLRKERTKDGAPEVVLTLNSKML